MDALNSQLNIDERLGKEFSRSSPQENLTIVGVKYLPTKDLLIDHEISIEFHKSNDFVAKGGVEIKILNKDDRKYFSDDLITEKDDHLILDLPFLNESKYPLSVWFYSVRLLIKNPAIEPWRSSLLLDEEFWQVPTDSSLSNENATKTTLIFGIGKNQGRRGYMEDVEFVFESVGVNEKRTVATFGVLDGHGGADCAQHAADDIPMKIAASLRKGMSCPDALFQSFRETDQEYLRNSSGNAGSTANVVLFDRSSQGIFIANTGDTRAILCRKGIAFNLSYDRKASDPEEIARIAKAGGFVMNGRVMGSLAVSRAFGDSSLKAPDRNVLICDPEISFFKPSKVDDFMLIATDGLWDVLSSTDAVNWTKEALAKENITRDTPFDNDLRTKLNAIAQNLVNYAIETMRSGDNVTVLLVLIRSENDAGRIKLPIRRMNGATETLGGKKMHSHRIIRENSREDMGSMRSIGEGYISQTSSKNAKFTPAPGPSVPVVKETDEDDLMSFLKDDKNFSQK